MAVSNTSLADHVMVFAGALSPEHCQALIGRFEAKPDRETCQLDAGYSFSQLNITHHWPDESQILVPVFLSYFNRYQAALNARFWPPKFSFEHLRIKRYLPNGRDLFPLHVDVMGQVAARRFMTAFIYLNAPDGGETVFPNLGISVAPEPGRLLAFPPLWLFPHAGLAPKSSPKYILHTYLCYPA
jgi:prolyl 4-hydroxylase